MKFPVSTLHTLQHKEKRDLSMYEIDTALALWNSSSERWQ